MNSLLFYKGMSKIYDLLDILYFKNNDRNPRKAIMNYVDLQDNVILDLCTGTASNIVAAARYNGNARIIGIDISKQMLRIAAKKLHKNNLTNVMLYHMDASKTKFENNTFDVIMISLVLHELSEETTQKVLKEAKRILKPDGKLLVLEWEEPHGLFKRILFYPIRKLEPKGFEQFLRIDNKSFYEKYGFQIIDIKHCDYSKAICLQKSSDKSSLIQF